LREGNCLTGEKNNFPLTIYTAERKEIIIKEQDELIDLITEKKGDLKTLLWHFGIGKEETVKPDVLIDARSIQLLDIYEFYKNPSDFGELNIWFETVKILNRIYDSK
jgi:hypothetical protein